MLKGAGFIFYAELMLLMRRSQEWIYPLVFFVIVISLFPLAFTPDPVFLQKIFPGCVWISALLANLLSIQPIFQHDLEEGSLEQWLLGQLPPSLLLFAKLSAHWLVAEFPLILLTPLLGLLFHLPFSTVLILCLSLLLGTPILTFIGCMGVALTLGLRQQGVLLGMLVLPLVIPVLIFGVNIVQQFSAGITINGPLAFLAGISLLTIALLPLTISAILRVSLDD